MSGELTDLLRRTAPEPSAGVDAGEIRRRVARRRRTRQLGVAVLAVLLVGAGAAVALVVRDGGQTVVADDPDRRTSEPEPRQGSEEGGLDDHGPALDPSDLPRLGDQGLAVEAGDRVVLVGMDGEVHGHVAGRFESPPPGGTVTSEGDAASVGLRSETDLLPVRATSSGRWRWLDPSAGESRDAVASGTPVGALRVLYDPDRAAMRLLRGQDDVASWPAGAPWWVSHDHRVVTWAPCVDGTCEHEFYDTDMGGVGELPAGCWVAAALGDFAQTRICDGGRRVVRADPGEPERPMEVPDGTDGRPATALAVFGDVVRVDHATCEIVEPMVIESDGLVPLLGGDRSAAPSAAPLGITNDGGVVLHMNTAACDAAHPDPGVYLLDRESGEVSLILSGAFSTDQVRFWRSTRATLGG